MFMFSRIFGKPKQETNEREAGEDGGGHVTFKGKVLI